MVKNLKASSSSIFGTKKTIKIGAGSITRENKLNTDKAR
jgi:hypothetical protein